MQVEGIYTAEPRFEAKAKALKLKQEMAAAAEKSIAEMEAANYGSAKETLIAALQNCEELYISGQEADQQD